MKEMKIISEDNFKKSVHYRKKRKEELHRIKGWLCFLKSSREYGQFYKLRERISWQGGAEDIEREGITHVGRSQKRKGEQWRILGSEVVSSSNMAISSIETGE